MNNSEKSHRNNESSDNVIVLLGNLIALGLAMLVDFLTKPER